jgi:hypothetical protein
VQNIRRFKGSDAELLKLYQEALKEVKAYLVERRRVTRRNAVGVAGGAGLRG